MRHAALHGIGGAVAMLAMLELVLQLLPVSTATRVDYHIDDGILTYPAHYNFTTATGWNLEHAMHHRSNNFGFLAEHDFTFDPDAVALIGDSYVEASMLPAAARPSAQLERALRGPRVYAFGGPGSSLLDYAARINFARKNFGIEKFVIIMELGDIKQSLCGSNNNHGPCLDPETLEPSRLTMPASGVLKRMLRDSALAQYGFSQLKLSPDRLTKFFANSRPALGAESTRPPPRSEPPGETTARITQHVVSEFFALANPSSTDRLVMLVDCDRRSLAHGGGCETPTRRRFIDMVELRGVEVVTPDDQFAHFIGRTGLRLEVSPRDAHWNQAAVNIVAHELAEVLDERN